jgi:hypothetical protein
MEKDLSVKSLANIDYAFRTSRYVSLGCIAGFLLISILLCWFYKEAIVRNIDRVYIARDFSIDRVTDKVAMVKGHVMNFYKLFFEIDQYNYKSNVNMALELIGESGKELNKIYANGNYYSRLVNNNLSIAVDIDSINVYNRDPPYKVAVYGKRYIRSSYGTKGTWLNAVMDVYQVSNSDKNPFGMMIEHFQVTNDADLPAN